MIKHLIQSPFPTKLKIGTVLDERCTCGHLRSEHGDTTSYGHGACGHHCFCQKYTWNTFILKTEVKLRGRTPKSKG